MFEESFAQSWQFRYGALPPFEAPPLDRFLAHRSVRKYSDREIPESTVSALVAAAQSASTSSSLQLWSVVSIQDPERRERMAVLCDNQNQVRRAPWFLAFLADHHRLRAAAAKVGEATEGLDYAEFYLMACVDAALAAERLVCAAESLGIAVCYIGALRNNPQGVSEELSLPPGVFGVFGLCLGYPHETVTSQIKPRLPQSSVWFRERYPEEVSIGDYDDRMRAFYESQKMSGDATWSMRSGRRADNHNLTGREVLREWLERRGFNRR